MDYDTKAVFYYEFFDNEFYEFFVREGDSKGNPDLEEYMMY